MFRSPKVTAPERSRLTAYIPLFVAAMLFFMIFEQAATTLSSFAQNRSELSFFGIAIEPAFFQSVNPFTIVVLAPVFAWIWVKTNDRPPTAVKFAMGLTLAALSFVWLSAASAIFADEKAPAWVLVSVYVIQTLGELCLSPVGLAATTLLAPKAFRSQAMALWFLAPAAGQAITAQIVQVTAGASDTAYFGVVGPSRWSSRWSCSRSRPGSRDTSVMRTSRRSRRRSTRRGPRLAAPPWWSNRSRRPRTPAGEGAVGAPAAFLPGRGSSRRLRRDPPLHESFEELLGADVRWLCALDAGALTGAWRRRAGGSAHPGRDSRALRDPAQSPRAAAPVSARATTTIASTTWSSTIGLVEPGPRARSLPTAAP
ncbi:oligopeptide:H+ symporter [Oerskovia sp. M15]